MSGEMTRETINPGLTMQLVQIKDIKKGDVFYEKGAWDRYKMTALEDGHFKGTIDVLDKTYDQYEVEVVSEFGKRFTILVTEGMNHYCGKFFK